MTSANSGERQFTMTMDLDGIIRLVWKRGVAIDEPLAREAMAAANELGLHPPHLILVDMAAIASLDRRARVVFGEPSKPTRIALVGTSQFDRLIANLGLRIIKPSNLIKIFANEAGAVAWLKAGRNGS